MNLDPAMVAAVARRLAELDAEPVTLADGRHAQVLVPGVAPVDPTAQALAAHSRRREARRASQPLPAGGLFDETARAQQELFG